MTLEDVKYDILNELIKILLFLILSIHFVCMYNRCLFIVFHGRSNKRSKQHEPLNDNETLKGSTQK